MREFLKSTSLYLCPEAALVCLRGDCHCLVSTPKVHLQKFVSQIQIRKALPQKSDGNHGPSSWQSHTMHIGCLIPLPRGPGVPGVPRAPPVSSVCARHLLPPCLQMGTRPSQDEGLPAGTPTAGDSPRPSPPALEDRGAEKLVNLLNGVCNGLYEMFTHPRNH